MPTTRVAEMLRLWRATRRLTVREAAAEIGTSYATLSRIERGHAMDLATWRKLETWLLAED